MMINMTSINESQKLQLEELYTKIHDERQCVTTKALSLEMGISRREAAALLELLPYFHSDNNGSVPSSSFVYDVTRCVWQKDNEEKFAVKLQKNKLKINPNSSTKPDEPNPDVIHSLALNVNNKGSPSPQSAHAYTMTLLFNALEDGSLIHQNCSIDNIIQPYTPVEISDKEFLRQKRIGAISGVHGRNEKRSSVTKASAPISSSSSSSSSLKMKKMKTTTAASFFGTSATKNKTVNVEKVNEKKDDSCETTIKSTTSKVSSNKENVLNSSSRSTFPTQNQKKIKTEDKGNADDFVGDEDEDEEFLQEEKERKERNALRDRHIANRRSKKQDIVISNDVESMDVDFVLKKEKVDVDEEEEVQEKIIGAIDAFATMKKETNMDCDASQRGRKRRKQVLEEKTFVDDNGFLRTETVSVWKDVEEDEEEANSKPDKETLAKKAFLPSQNSIDKKPTKAKSTKGMKQQGLMGFFAAKKK